MGYTHSFVYQPGSAQYAAAWPAILSDTRWIMRAVRRHGVVMRGPAGTRQPVLDPQLAISFNGDAAAGLDLDPFTLNAPHPVGDDAPADCRVWRFVKTEERPYDLAVATVLLRAHILAPDVFAIGSSGEWGTDWIAPAGHNPRDLVADLFGVRVEQDPLTDPTQGMAIGPAGWIDPRLADNPVIP